MRKLHLLILIFLVGISFTSNSQSSENVFITICSGEDVTYNDGTIHQNVVVDESYTSVFQDQGGQDSTITVNVFVLPTPDVNTLIDTTIACGDTVILTTSSTSANYNWTPEDWLSCTDCQSPMSIPYESMRYIVEVTENGCSGYDTVYVTVNCDEYFYFVPNVFSPNGDNENDVLKVEGVSVDFINFDVFNRWGERVHTHTKIDDVWDGEFRGVPLDAGVYFYTLKITYKDGNIIKTKGDITLLR